MKKFLLTFLALAPCLFAAEIEEGFVPITNGNDLIGWKVIGGRAY